MSNAAPTFLEQFFQVQMQAADGSFPPKRPTLKVVGGTLSDDAVAGVTTLTITDGGGGQNDLALANGLNSNIATAGLRTQRIGGPTAAFSVGGFTSGAAGLSLLLTNPTAYPMTVVHEDLASTAANRIDTQSSGAPIILQPKTGSVFFLYDTSASRWVVQNVGVHRKTKYDVRDFGALGDGATTSTAFVLATIAAISAAGGGTLHFPQTGAAFLVDAALDLPSNCVVEIEGTVKQTAATTNLFTATGKSGIKFIGGGILVGHNGSAPNTYLSTEQAIKLTGCSDVSIAEGISINGFRGHGLYLLGCTDVRVGAIDISQCCGGLRMRGNKRVKLVAPTVRDTTSTAFTVGFGLDSTDASDGIVYGYNTDITAIGASVKSYPNSQAYLIHAGERLNFIGCSTQDGDLGFSVNCLGGQYTYTNMAGAGFTQPAVGSSVSLTVVSSSLLVQGQTLLLPGCGVYTVASIDSGTGIHLTNTGHLLNAAVGATGLASSQNGTPVKAGDICRTIAINGFTYEGTTTTESAPDGTVGIVLGGDPGNPITNIEVRGGAISNGGFNNAGAATGGLYMTYVQGAVVDGIAIDRCYGTGIYVDVGCSDLRGGAFLITNTIAALGRRAAILVTGCGSSGHFSNFTINGADDGVRYDVNNTGHGAVAAVGTDPPNVFTTGAVTPSTQEDMTIAITTGGTLASGNVRASWSLGGVVQATGVVISASVTLNGVALTFNAGTYTNDNVYSIPLTSRGLVADRFIAENVTNRGANVPYGCVDGVFYKPVNQTAPVLHPLVQTVIVNDTTPTSIDYPLTGCFIGQEVTYQSTVSNSNATTITRNHATLPAAAAWASPTASGHIGAIRLKYVGGSNPTMGVSASVDNS